jgi:hypothetical protein
VVHTYSLARSTFIMLAHVPLLEAKAHYLAPGLAFQPNVALIIYAVYQIYYFLLEPIGAVSIRH